MKILRYQIRCCNEWCNGPEIWKCMDKKPIVPMPCPTCGWLSLPNDTASVQPIFDDISTNAYQEKSDDGER
jgi:hypothetical protein